MMAKKSFDKKQYAALLAQTLPRVIESKQEYEEAFSTIISLMHKGKKRSLEETALLTLLTVLVEKYEINKFTSSEKSDALDMLKHLMEANNHTAKDLWTLADKAVISKVLAGERAISKNLAKALSSFYKVPIGMFI